MFNFLVPPTAGSVTAANPTTTVNVVAGPATHFSVSAPAAATSGAAFNFTVTALDFRNNIATGYTGTVHFTSSDGAAVLPVNLTLTNGVGTVSATLKTVGSQTITATDTVTASITGTSSPINVTAAGGAATHFSVSAPASATPGTAFGFTVTALDANNNTSIGYAGTVHFTSSDGTAVLPANSALTNGVGNFTATLRAAGSQTITATDTVTSSITGISSTIVVGQKNSTVTLTSSQNPSGVGQLVTFSATVTGGGTPTGTVSFKDGTTVIGIGTLNASGIATFATSSLAQGSHSITASYSGDIGNLPNTSTALIQTVNLPTDSLKLRAMQIVGTKIEAQSSGQATAGAIHGAIADGFSANSALITGNDNGVHFNFAAEPQEKSNIAQERVSDAFSALGYAPDQTLTKAPPRAVPKEWLTWADIRGTGWATGLQAGDIRGGQINALLGLTRKLTPDLLVGVFGGYENFDYTSQLLDGQLKGNGWTAGGYLGWRLPQGLRFDAGVARSGISYDDVAGTAAATFPGQRWLATAALIGTYKIVGVEIEPSAKVYAVWEHDNAFVDSLGIIQTDRNFSTGRASAGAKFALPLMWSGTSVAPYFGIYADYYFNRDNAALGTAPLLLPTEFIQGWSARTTTGVAVTTSLGTKFSIGGELGGLGSSQFNMWSMRGRVAIPF
jgi:hypothetical protein